MSDTAVGYFRGRARRQGPWEPAVGFTCSLPVRVITALEELAYEARISRSGMGRTLIEEALAARGIVLENAS